MTKITQQQTPQVQNLKQQNSPVKKADQDRYDAQQQTLGNQIINPPNGVEDLKYNAKIKEQQITLANQHGDKETAKILTTELARINKDISRAETSIFQ